MSETLPLVEEDTSQLQSIGGEVAGLAQPLSEAESAFSEFMQEIQERQNRTDLRRTEYEDQTVFFRQAFYESLEVPEIRTTFGPHHKDINNILSNCSKLLTSIDPGLPIEVLVPHSYQSYETQQLMRQLKYGDQETHRKIMALRRARRATLDNFAVTQMPLLEVQELAPGVLDKPDFVRQYSTTACVGTNFIMVMDAITGSRTNPEAFRRQVSRVHNSEMIRDDDFLKILNTPAFTERFGKTAKAFSFLGADIEMINKIAQDIREKLDVKKVLCVVSLLSETYENPEDPAVWHSSVLLSADNEHVFVHDPSAHHGYPNRKIPKADFYRRWIQAYFRGYIVVSD